MLQIVTLVQRTTFNGDAILQGCFKYGMFLTGVVLQSLEYSDSS